jgi:hypothetical protein
MNHKCTDILSQSDKTGITPVNDDTTKFLQFPNLPMIK